MSATLHAFYRAAATTVDHVAAFPDSRDRGPRQNLDDHRRSTTSYAPALPASQVCVLLLTVAAATVVVSACKSGNASGTTVQQGGVYTESRTCTHIGQPNAGLSAAGGAAFTSGGQGKGCYFDVQNASTNLTAYSTLSVPVASAQSPFTPTVAVRIYDAYTGNQIGDGGLNYLVVAPPPNSNYYTKDVQVTYPAGKFNDDPNKSYPWRLRDSVYAYFDNLQSQYTPAFGTSLLIGVRDDLYPPGVTGPNAVISDQTPQFGYRGGASPDGVSYRWWIDGVLQRDTTVSFLAPPMAAGVHTVKVTATRNGDGTSTTVSMGVVSKDRTSCSTCPQ